MNDLASRILDALPQTQCTRCGFPDCAGYADAVANGQADIDQCPPGGAEGVRRLAHITGGTPKPLNAAFGTEGPRALAVIDEAWCIGCTLCLDACPTDAILGMNKRMHTVIPQHCTGCELCIPVCPVDCISLTVATPGRSGWDAWSASQAAHARQRYDIHRARRRLDEPLEPLTDEPAAPQHTDSDTEAQARKRAVVEAALARARQAAAARDAAQKPRA